VTPPLLLSFNRFLAAAIALAAAAAAAAAFSAFSSFAFRAPCTPDEEPNRRPSERTQSALRAQSARPDDQTAIRLMRNPIGGHQSAISTP